MHTNGIKELGTTHIKVPCTTSGEAFFIRCTPIYKAQKQCAQEVNRVRNTNFFSPFMLLNKIDTALQEGVEGLKLLLLKGLTESARRFNTEQKYKHIRLQTMPT
ncbi:hypothetical protein Gotur_020293 [Gossypium turneri]